ncbi:hypothetical protein LXL04_020897 [Taraxacum kok-saghyz]
MPVFDHVKVPAGLGSSFIKCSLMSEDSRTYDQSSFGVMKEEMEITLVVTPKPWFWCENTGSHGLVKQHGVNEAWSKLHAIVNPIPEESPANPRAPHTAWQKHLDDSNEVASLMLVSMIPESKKDFELLTAYDMLAELMKMFQQQARVERFETVRS